MRRIFTLIFSLFILSACEKGGGDESEKKLPDAELKTEVLTQSLVFPWEMVYGSDNYIWFTERAGKISRLNPKNGVIALVHTITEVNSTGEGGLLGMALHPDFNNNPYVYVIYDYKSGTNYRGKVVRFTFNNGVLLEPLVLLDQIPASSNHDGSRLLITPDMKLLVTTGDANTAANAQDTSSLSGKILRINLDGSIPEDNPFPGNRIWTYGHRNPQGLVLANNKVYSSEHGPNNDDEVNLIEKGKNYGWPNIEGFCNTTTEKAFCALNEVTEPMMAWTPTIAPSGLIYYDSDYLPQWKNSLLMVTLKGTKLVQLKLDETGDKVTGSQDFFLNQFGRLRAVCQSPDGKVYLATSNGVDDKIIEVSTK
ncbi:PQQ-dependent sugar dehydrogenase [Pedobacter hartonius]|uniref:Dehydrogenase, PQQ-dependent, s-GDH family n=1 Tax=Pedobacter hartonius TaxID=425514 RepID=A0A1H4CKJ3_9SPHI|nr:PQQ-dependent sugar dehydrogenase [Pedobacter hartonius]SEA60582.1 dehydrogenase, PQQ-dependent, s-GDH family [Pedobacter hartonius]